MWVNNEREGKIESPRHTNVEWAHDKRQSQRKHNRQPMRSGTRPVIPADATDRPALVPEPWPVLDLRRASTEPPAPFDFVVPGLMAGTVGALVSPGGTGKSMWALQMALSLSAGVDTLGLGSRVSGGQPVVFLSAEDQASVLHARIYAMSQRLGVHLPTAWRYLQVSPLAGLGVDLMDDGWLEAIARAASGARLIVIDTLRRFHHLDENDGGAMAQLLARLEAMAQTTGAATLFLHHTSKAAAMVAGDAQQASRGSSVLTDNVRFQVNLVTMSAEQAKAYRIEDSQRRQYVRLSYAKINYAAPMPDQWFIRREHGVLEPVALWSEVGNPTGKKARARDEL